MVKFKCFTKVKPVGHMDNTPEATKIKSKFREEGVPGPGIFVKSLKV